MREYRFVKVANNFHNIFVSLHIKDTIWGIAFRNCEFWNRSHWQLTSLLTDCLHAIVQPVPCTWRSRINMLEPCMFALRLFARKRTFRSKTTKIGGFPESKSIWKKRFHVVLRCYDKIVNQHVNYKTSTDYIIRRINQPIEEYLAHVHAKVTILYTCSMVAITHWYIGWPTSSRDGPSSSPLLIHR